MAEPRELEALTVEECFDLIRHQTVGRIAVGTVDGPPLVVPVTFVLDESCVTFRSDAGEKLAGVGQRVSFQVDAIDPTHRTGWSVLLQGTLSVVDGAEVDVEPWVGPRTYLLRLVPDVVTGRRLVLNVPDLDGRGYR